MADENDDLDDDEAVEMSNDMRRALKADDDQDDESEDAQDDESDDDQDDESDDARAADPEKPGKAKQSAQDRIKELAKLRRDAEKAAFDLEMRNLELERQLAERMDAKPEAPKAPNPKDFSYGEVDPDYLTAMVDYKVSLREQDIRAEAAKGARQAAESTANERYGRRLSEVMSAGKKAYKDFEEVLGSTNYEPALARMVLDSENAVDIAYYLSNNVSELRTLTRADASERARIIGRLEGRFSAAPAVKKRTKAPEALGSHRSREDRKPVGRYGPDSQDEFDKAFYR